MPDTQDLQQLMAEYGQVDVAAEPLRARELLTRATGVVDRAATPLKWAGLRSLFADLVERDDPAAAIAGYRDALSVWHPVEQRAFWSHCHMQLGCLLSAHPPGTADGEAALVHLEQAVDDHPWVARLLATLIGFRPAGDPAENWQRRRKYLELALAQTDPAVELDRWAAVSNELAISFQDEPAGDYAAALTKRIALHHAVLEALRAAGADVVPTCLHLATAYLDRPDGDPASNGQAAECYIDEGLAACGPGTNSAVRIELLLLRGRCLTFKRASGDRDALRSTLEVFGQARELAASRPEPELRASVEKLCALAWLELLRLGERQHREPFLDCCRAALRLFSSPTAAPERRKVLQIQADGLLELGEVAAAAECCEQAVALAERRLAEAATLTGRLERIWELRDSAALLAWCRATGDDLTAAVDALDRGKVLLWDRTDRGPASRLVAALIPPGGALVMPVFARGDGMAIVATRADGGARLTRVDLPGFGKPRVLELQRGASPARLGGWLEAYYLRGSAPERFHEALRSIGQVLYEEFWTPVLAALSPLGVGAGSELVLFPHGGSAVLPMQAAWTMEGGRQQWLTERHAVRYAPSIATLARGVAATPAMELTIVAANPDGDLVFDAFEVASIRAVHPDARVLVGPEATPARVLAALNASTHVHIASHADFNVEDPFASRIRLAGGDVTVLEMQQHVAAGRPRFIALSACETAVTRVTSLADEFLGFPAALLEAGVGTVLATQWPVHDESAAMLMAGFYRASAAAPRTADGVPPTPAQALREAQNWLRTLTVAGLSVLLWDMREAPGAAGAAAEGLRERLHGRDQAECPFAHPFYWAGFCVLGGT